MSKTKTRRSPQSAARGTNGAKRPQPKEAQLPKKPAPLGYAPATAARPGQSPRRKLLVFGGLFAFLLLASGLLKVLSTQPLAPGAADSLSAVEPSRLFDTSTPIPDGHWRYIYIHHSRTPAGNSNTLAGTGTGPDGGLPDHFVIGNGDGCGDGEVQVAVRWKRQQPPGRLPGLAADERLSDDCVSICLIGDFDHARPTPTQVLRLTQLVQALQDRLDIPADRVRWLPNPASPAGIGRHFPLQEFRQQLLP